MREIDRNESRARKKRERKTFERKENRKFKKPESFVGGNGETVLLFVYFQGSANKGTGACKNLRVGF